MAIPFWKTLRVTAIEHLIADYLDCKEYDLHLYQSRDSGIVLAMRDSALNAWKEKYGQNDLPEVRRTVGDPINSRDASLPAED
jgi:hypothetical protein